MEIPEIKKIPKKEADEKMQVIMLFLITIFIICLIVTISLLLHYKNLIISDPLSYGMEVHGFTSCSCYDSDNKYWESTDNGFRNIQTPNNNLNNLFLETWDKKK